MKVDGQCHCGALKFEAEAESNRFSICHCLDCQTMSSSAFSAALMVPIEKFRMTSGNPQIYIKKTAASGIENLSAFCPTCGTRIYSCAVTSPKEVRVRVGTINQRSSLLPARQIWKRSALCWIEDIGQVPSFEQNPTGSSTPARADTKEPD